jgi:hypothetical protein
LDGETEDRGLAAQSGLRRDAGPYVDAARARWLRNRGIGGCHRARVAPLLILGDIGCLSRAGADGFGLA